MNKLNALSLQVDRKTRDYVAELERVLRADFAQDVDRLTNALKAQAVHTQMQRDRITELEAALKEQSATDKYTLTKAKLIRLMKEMGYYD